MDFQLLFNEISQPQYAGMTDAEIVAALNAQTAVRRRVPISDLQARAMESGVYTALRVAVATPGTPEQLRAVCQTVLDLANARFTDVDLDNAASQQMFGALRQAGVITADQAAAIDALATTGYTSRARALGLGAVTVEDIERSRIVPQLDALRMRLAAGYSQAVALLDAASDAPTWGELVAVVGGA